MKTILKNKLKIYQKKRYDSIHKKQALDALKTIQEDTGYELTKKQKSMIKEYAVEILGSASYVYWLYVYTAYNQQFKEGWIPDNYFGYVVAPKVNKGIGEISNIKTLSKKIIQTDLLPDKFYIIDKILYDQNFKIIQRENIEHILFSESDEYFLKKDSSNQGRGVFKITKENFNIECINNSGDAVIQRPIIQSKWFDEIVTGSVATIRITTLKKNDGTIKLAASYLRLGRKNTDIVQSKSAIRVPIMDDLGNLGEYGSDPLWKRHYKHPDTQYKFAGSKIPNFNKAIEYCLKMHRKIPFFTIIGWDVSITDENEPQIMEWNARHPDIRFTEASLGPSFIDLGWEHLHK